MCQNYSSSDNAFTLAESQPNLILINASQAFSHTPSSKKSNMKNSFLLKMSASLVLLLALSLSANAQTWSGNTYLTGWFGDVPTNTPNATPAGTAPGNAFSASPMSGGPGLTLSHVTESSITILRMANINSTTFADAVTNDDYITSTLTAPTTGNFQYRLSQSLNRTYSGLASSGAVTYTLVIKDLTTNVSTNFVSNIALSPSTAFTTSTAPSPYRLIPGRSYELRWYVSTTSATNVTRNFDNPQLFFQTATCLAGGAAPTLSGTTATIACPSLAPTNLNSLHSGSIPSGASLVWSTDGDPSDGISSTVTSPVYTAGIYYAYYRDVPITAIALQVLR